MLNTSAIKWKIDLPEEAAATFTRAAAKWGTTEFSASPTGGFSETSPQLHSKSANSTSGPSQDPHELPMKIQQTPSTHSSLPHAHNGLLPSMAQSPSSSMSEARKSSGGMSLPPQSASDLSRDANKVRPSRHLTHLTQAQQDAWDRHQASRAASNTHSSENLASTEMNANAATLFGGVDSLVEESQDWWLKDQSALALGFDNWVDVGTEWAGMGYGSDFNDGRGSGNGLNENGDSSTGPRMNGNGAGYTYPAKSGNGYTAYNTAQGQGVNGGSTYRHGARDSFDEEMYFQ